MLVLEVRFIIMTELGVHWLSKYFRKSITLKVMFTQTTIQKSYNDRLFIYIRPFQSVSLVEINRQNNNCSDAIFI